jgi:penicillin-binding protein 1C
LLKYCVAVFCILGALLFWIARDPTPFPGVAEVRSLWRPTNAYLLDRHGELIHELRVDFSVRRGNWTRLDAISPALIKAVLTAEDRRFHVHRGVDWLALGAALWGTLTGEGARGASTVSMQVASMLDEDLAPKGGRRSLLQKLRQIRAARQLEAVWTKDEILETYLNRVGFRGEFQGVDAAARGLFGKSPSGLTAGEALVLAALLPSPNASLDRVSKRACAIDVTARFSVGCEELKNIAAGVFAVPGRFTPGPMLAPHVARQWLDQPGEKVFTTLDKDIQQTVTEALREQLRGLTGRNVRDGAALAVDNLSGEVLAYVGSAGPASSARLVDGVRALRQAGSTLKPFLYGLAFEKRYLTAASILDDSPVHLETPGGLYIPQNYDKDFKGRVSVRTALAGSLNVPAVRTLILTGLHSFHERLKALGYGNLVEDGEHYGFSLALGSAEVSLWEQVNAYRTLANGGVYGPLRLTPEGGNVSEKGSIAANKPNKPERRVMSPEAAFIVADILNDRAGRAVTFGLETVLATPFWSAVKTGTSKDMRDNWCIGFTSRYTVGVWVGNFEGDAMRDVSGVTGAAPVWLAIMNTLHQRGSPEAPLPPPRLLAREVRFQSAIEPPRQEWFIAGTEMPLVVPVDPGRSSPRIQSPPNGMIIAIDPDIPRENQVLLFTASGVFHGSQWVLDGVAIGGAESPRKWAPTPGRHTLTLQGKNGQALARTDFQVRGK